MAQAMLLRSTAPHASKIAPRRPDRSATSTFRKSSNPRVSRTRAEASADGSLERRELSLARRRHSSRSRLSPASHARMNPPTLTQVYNDEEDKIRGAERLGEGAGRCVPKPAVHAQGDRVLPTRTARDQRKRGRHRLGGTTRREALDLPTSLRRSRRRNDGPKPRQGPKQFSYVVDAKNAGDRYVIEYTVERPERVLSAPAQRRGYRVQWSREPAVHAHRGVSEDRYAEMEPMFRKFSPHSRPRPRSIRERRCCWQLTAHIAA